MPAQTAAAPTATGVRRRLRLWLLLMVVFLSWAAYTLYNQYTQMNERSAQLQEANRKLSEAEKTSEMLEQEIIRLDDPEYIGQMARKQGLGLPGEQPIRIKKNEE